MNVYTAATLAWCQDYCCSATMAAANAWIGLSISSCCISLSLWLQLRCCCLCQHQAQLTKTPRSRYKHMLLHILMVLLGCHPGSSCIRYPALAYVYTSEQCKTPEPSCFALCALAWAPSCCKHAKSYTLYYGMRWEQVADRQRSGAEAGSSTQFCSLHVSAILAASAWQCLPARNWLSQWSQACMTSHSVAQMCCT